MSDVLNLTSSGLSETEFNYATRAHFDFLLCKQNYPQLAMEFDFRDREDKEREQAKVKDQICANLGLPFVRVDGTYLDRLEVSSITQELISEWKAGKHTDLAHAWSRCCLHYECDLVKCKAFQEVASWLFAAYEDCSVQPFSISIGSEIESDARDGYVSIESRLFLQSGKSKCTVGTGRCCCSGDLVKFGKRASERLAAWAASIFIQGCWCGMNGLDDRPHAICLA